MADAMKNKKIKISSVILGEPSASPEEFLKMEDAKDKLISVMQLLAPELKEFNAYETSCLCGSILATVLFHLKYDEPTLKAFFELHRESLLRLEEDMLKKAGEENE